MLNTLSENVGQIFAGVASVQPYSAGSWKSSFRDWTASQLSMNGIACITTLVLLESVEVKESGFGSEDAPFSRSDKRTWHPATDIGPSGHSSEVQSSLIVMYSAFNLFHHQSTTRWIISILAMTWPLGARYEVTCLSSFKAHVFGSPHSDPCRIARLGSIAKTHLRAHITLGSRRDGYKVNAL